MQINYCDSCGLRISTEDMGSGAAFQDAQQRNFCPKCAPAHRPAPAPPRATTTRMPGLRSPATATSAAAAPRPASSSSAAPRAGSGSHTVWILIGSAGLAGIAAALFFLLSGNRNQPVAETKTKSEPAFAPATTPAQKSADVKPADPANPAATPPGTESAPPSKEKVDAEIDEVREGYARRKWTELKERAKGPALTDHLFRKEIKAFSMSQKTTAAGRAAEAFLKQMPPLDPPLPEPGSVVAAYGRDFKPGTPAQGWSYLWNEGDIGASSKYKALVWNGPKGGYAAQADVYPVGPPPGWVRLDAQGGHPGCGMEQKGAGTDRFAIAAYTLQAGQGGKLAVMGNVTRNQRSVGIELRVYVNDTQKFAMKTGGELEIAVNLGTLKDGDTVYTCVGPDRLDGSDTFSLDFSLYRIP